MRASGRYHKWQICLVLLLSAITTGCVAESSGPDAACRWSGDTAGPLNLRDDGMARHLSEDAVAAQVIAIRYADGHSRPGTAFGATMADYNNTRDQCMASLFQVIADQHHVTPQQVRESMDSHPRTSLDALVVLSFALVYTFFVNRFVRGIWRRFPPAEDRLLGILSTIVISPVAGFLGLETGEGWSRYTEALRIGYGHLNLRAERIPWAHHRLSIFTAGVLIFWIVSWLRYRDARSRPAQNPSSLGLATWFAPSVIVETKLVETKAPEE